VRGRGGSQASWYWYAGRNGTESEHRVKKGVEPDRVIESVDRRPRKGRGFKDSGALDLPDNCELVTEVVVLDRLEFHEVLWPGATDRGGLDISYYPMTVADSYELPDLRGGRKHLAARAHIHRTRFLCSRASIPS
jgi:hypothetical protein